LVWQYSPGDGGAGELGKIPNIAQFRGIKCQLIRVIFSYIFMMLCLGATVGRQIGDPYLMRHLAAKSADLMLVNLPHYSYPSEAATKSVVANPKTITHQGKIDSGIAPISLSYSLSLYLSLSLAHLSHLTLIQLFLPSAAATKSVISSPQTMSHQARIDSGIALIFLSYYLSLLHSLSLSLSLSISLWLSPRMIMTALYVAFWATLLLVLVDHVSKQCLLYEVGCAIIDSLYLTTYLSFSISRSFSLSLSLSLNSLTSFLSYSYPMVSVHSPVITVGW
jgi:hypothetical protein